MRARNDVIFRWRKKKDMPGRILVIDDEPQITRVLRAALSAQGYDVRTANDPEEGLRVFKDWPPDLVITDLMMPGMSGVEVCRAIRSQGATPVLVLSVREHERSKVEALDAGADDYVTKPFGIQELLARVRAHLRRAPERTHGGASRRATLWWTRGAHSITVQGKPIHLTPKEFDLLLHLARNAGKVMTHRALLTAVWGAQSAHQPEYLRVFVGQLRKKLEGETGKPIHPDRALGGLPVCARGLERRTRSKLDARWSRIASAAVARCIDSRWISRHSRISGPYDFI